MLSRLQILLFASAAALALVVIDLTTPAEVVVTPLYFAVVLLALWSPSAEDALLTATICTALTVIGYLADRNPAGWYLANGIVTLSAIWIAAAIGMVRKRRRIELISLTQALEENVAQRTVDLKRHAEQLAAANQELESQVSQRRRFEQELRHSEAMYRSLLDNLPVQVLSKDLDGRITFANSSYCSLVEREREDILGHSAFDIDPPELAAKYRQDDLTVAETGEMLVDVETNRSGDKISYVHVMKTPARDADGTIVGTQAIFWDVTARRMAEQALRESEALYHSLVDTLPMCIARKDLGGRFTFANRAFCELCGLDTEEIYGKTDLEIFPSEFASSYRESDARVLATGEMIEEVEVHRKPDGETIEVRMRKMPWRDADGNTLGTQVIFWDVTELRRAEVALRESRERLDLALSAAAIGTWNWELDSGVTLWDERMHAIFGLEPGSFAGSHEEFSKLVNPQDIERVMWTVEQTLENDTPLDVDYRISWPDGAERHVTARAMVLKDEQGKPQRMTGVCLDVTDRKRAESELARHAAELEYKNRELEEFAYIASHDLQEPLRTLTFFSQALVEDLQQTPNEKAQKDLDFIATAAQRMQDLVQDLLALSRAGRAEIQQERMSLGASVNRAIEALGTKIQETGAEVQIDELPEVVGDMTLMDQLFQNLIGNAIKFTDSGAPRVHITAESSQDEWIVGVRDNGIGLKPDYAEKIFAPFQRLHGRNEYEGTGIGLAICRKVVERHGGRIWVESTPGDGAHFKFTLQSAEPPRP